VPTRSTPPKRTGRARTALRAATRTREAADTTLRFLGAAREVTGSCMLVDAPHARFLVDCGMFQGGRDAYARNAQALDFDVATLDFVALTHAHIDHSGLLPRLRALGFRGPIHATPPTCDLLGVMLPDSAYIQESQAAHAAKRAGERSHRDEPAQAALYTVADAEACLAQLEPVAYDASLEPAPGIRLRWRDAGHILGSAIIEAWLEGAAGTRKIVFSGDLGQPGRPVLNDPARIDRTDVLVVESTYGNRLHKPLGASVEELVGVLRATLPRGNVVVPAFAVGRTQEILHVLAQLVRENRVAPLTIFVDSPLATRATEITIKYAATLDRDSRDLARWQATHRDRVRVRFTESVDDSIAINSVRSGAVIIAASGMCEAGRIRHHLRHNAGRSECAIVFTGFQAAGTLGRRIVDGARTIQLFGDELAVNASVHTIGGLSAHADRDALVQWLRAFEAPPRDVYVVHGEEGTAEQFAATVRETFGWPAVSVPGRGDRVTI
jgi:metallo-beta-lactamase family protein